jgi:hypothetical protein
MSAASSFIFVLMIWSEPCSFICLNQHQLWSLPIFEDPKSVKSSAIFELIINFQTVVGLTEDGRDKLDGSFPLCASFFDDDIIRLSRSQAERRFRLGCFCLRFIEETVSHRCAQVNKSDLALASICLSSLLCDSSLHTLKTLDRLIRAVELLLLMNMNLRCRVQRSRKPRRVCSHSGNIT